ncbi:aldo/keto reductase [Lentinula aff. detonsa]|nr:aldo/keto reductase [Lentinula aff. detonsa]
MIMQSVKLGYSFQHIRGPSRSHVIPSPVSDEQACEAIKASVDALPDGVKMFLNSGEFYDNNWGIGNLKLLSRFFANHPAYAEKTFLSVKGGMSASGPDGSLEGLRRSKLDLFELAQIDLKLPVETTMKNLVTLLKEGKFSHIGLSGCNANTLRKAHSLNISVLAYSPLGQGFLTGQIKSPADADIPEGDMRAKYDRLKAITMEKKLTPAQLCIGWVASLGPTNTSSWIIASRTLENWNVQLTQEDKKAVEEVISVNPVAGERYFGAALQMYLWG